MNDQDNYDSQAWGQQEQDEAQQWERHKSDSKELNKILGEMKNDRFNGKAAKSAKST